MAETQELAIVVSVRDEATAALAAIKSQLAALAPLVAQINSMSLASGTIATSMAAVGATTGATAIKIDQFSKALAESNVISKLTKNGVYVLGQEVKTAGETAKTAGISFSGLWKTIKSFVPILGAAMAFREFKKAIRASIQATLDFNEAMHDVWTLTDKTWTQMKGLSSEVRNFARGFNVSSTEAAKALYQIYSSTFYGADAMKILKSATKGAAAGLADVYSAADMTTTILNAYRMSASEANKVQDLLFTAVKYGKVRYEELTEQFGRLAGVAAPVGAGLAEMTAAIATLTRAGIETDWAVTSLRQTLMQMLRPTANLKLVISSLGYASGTAMVHALGFAKSLKAITAYAKANNIEMSQMFTNVRAITAVLPLTSTLAGEYAKDLERAATSTGTMNKAFTKQTQSWSYQLSKIKTAINDTAISIGKDFVPALLALLSAIQAILYPLGKAMELFSAIGGDYMIAIVTTVGTLTAALWLLSKAWVAVAAKAALATTSMVASGGIMKIIAGGAGGLLGGLGMLGVAGLALGATVKAVVNLDIKPGEVLGAEAAKRTLSDTLESVLGPIVGGAIIGNMFAPGGIGALIGAGIGAAVSLVITVIHEIKKGNEIASATAHDLVNKANLPYSVTPSGFLELAQQISGVGITAKGTTDVLKILRNEIYKMKDGVWVLNGVTEETHRVMEAFSKITGGLKLTSEQAKSLSATLIEDYRNKNRVAIPPRAVSKSEVNKIANEYVAQLNSSFETIMDRNTFSRVLVGFRNSIDTEVQKLQNSADRYGFSVSKIANISADLVTAGNLPLEQHPIEAVKGIIDNLTQSLANAKVPPDVATEIVYKITQSLSTDFPNMFKDMFLGAFSQTEDGLSAWLMSLWKRAQAAAKTTTTNTVPVETVRTDFATAQKDWANLTSVISNSSKTAEDVSKAYKDMGSMASFWLTISQAISSSFPGLSAEIAAQVKKWQTEMGDKLPSAIKKSADDLFESFSVAKKAFGDSAKGTLENAIAETSLASISQKLAGYQKALGLDAGDLTGKWKKMSEWLKSVGITVGAATQDWDDQIKALAVVMNDGTKTALERASAEQSLVSLYTQLENIEKTSSLPDVVIAAKAAMDSIKLLGISLTNAKNATETFNDAINSVTLTLGNAASQIMSAFSNLEAAFQKATTLGDLAATAAGLISGTGNLKELKENLERIVTGTGYAAATVEKAKRELAQLVTGPTPGKTFAEIQADVNAKAIKAAQNQASAMQEAASVAQKAAQEAAQATQDAISTLKKKFSDMFNIPAEEGLATGNWKEAASAIVGLAQHRKDIEAFAKSISDVTGETISATDVMGMIKQAGSKLLDTLQNEIDLARLAGESTTDLEKFQIAVKDIIDPLRRFKKEIIDSIITSPGQAGADARALLISLMSGINAETLKIPSHKLGGFVDEGGFVYVHPGETIIPADTSGLSMSGLSLSGAASSNINMPSISSIPDTTFTNPPSFSNNLGDISSSIGGIADSLNTAISSLGRAANSAATPVSQLTRSVSQLTSTASSLSGSVSNLSSDAFRLKKGIDNSGSAYAPSTPPSVPSIITKTPAPVTAPIPVVIDTSAIAPPSAPSEDALAQIAKTQAQIAETQTQIAEANKQAAKSRAVTEKANKLTAQIPKDLDSIIKQYAPQGVDLAGAGNDVASSFEALNNKVKIYQDTISMMETYISDLDFMGMSDAANTLKDRLYEFKAAIQGTTVAAMKFKEAFAGIITTLHNSFNDLFSIILESAFGMSDEIKKSMASANVPSGFKLTRAAWGVATPGQPWEEGGGAKSSLDTWLDNLKKGIIDAIASGISKLVWDDFIVPIVWNKWIKNVLWNKFIIPVVWEKWIKKFLWETVIKKMLWGNFIKPLIWDPFLAPAIEAIGGFVTSLLSAGSALATFAGGVLVVFGALTALGAIIGVIEGVLAFLVGAFQGIGDLLSAFLQPIVAAVAQAWKDLTPLIDGARQLFSALSPIMSMLGETIAWGIQLITPLFAALGPVLGVLGVIIRTVADAIKLIWDYTIKPVMDAFAFAIKLLVFPIQWIATALWNIGVAIHNAIEVIKHLLRPDLRDIWEYKPLPAIPTFSFGGIVPGATGSPQFIVAHGGEQVLTPAQQRSYGGGDTYIYNVTLPGVTNAKQFDEELEKIIRRKNLRKSGVRTGGYALSGA